MTKVFSKVLLIVPLFAILLLITGCFLTNIEKVELKTDLSGEICVNDFKLSDLELLVTYDDRSINYVPVSEDMVSSEDLAKLKTVGIHTFTINYKGLKVEATVDLVEEPKDPIKEVRLSVNNKKYDEIIFVGNGAILHKDILNKNIKNAKFSEENKQFAKNVGALGYKKYLEKNLCTADTVVPIYLRKSQAERLKKD